MYILLFVLAILSLILIPLAPKLVRLRIRILRWLHWNWAVNLLEKHFDLWVLFFRVILLVIAAMLLYEGLEDFLD
jgi:drug/metabolite transporter (DMT)-like permease